MGRENSGEENRPAVRGEEREQINVHNICRGHFIHRLTAAPTRIPRSTMPLLHRVSSVLHPCLHCPSVVLVTPPLRRREGDLRKINVLSVMPFSWSDVHDLNKSCNNGSIGVVRVENKRVACTCFRQSCGLVCPCGCHLKRSQVQGHPLHENESSSIVCEGVVEGTRLQSDSPPLEVVEQKSSSIILLADRHSEAVPRG